MMTQGGTLGAATKKVILDEYALKHLQPAADLQSD
jgi:hypothetical protein